MSTSTEKPVFPKQMACVMALIGHEPWRCEGEFYLGNMKVMPVFQDGQPVLAVSITEGNPVQRVHRIPYGLSGCETLSCETGPWRDATGELSDEAEWWGDCTGSVDWLPDGKLRGPGGRVYRTVDLCYLCVNITCAPYEATPVYTVPDGGQSYTTQELLARIKSHNGDMKITCLYDRMAHAPLLERWVAACNRIGQKLAEAAKTKMEAKAQEDAGATVQESHKALDAKRPHPDTSADDGKQGDEAAVSVKRSKRDPIKVLREEAGTNFMAGIGELMDLCQGMKLGAETGLDDMKAEAGLSDAMGRILGMQGLIGQRKACAALLRVEAAFGPVRGS